MEIFSSLKYLVGTVALPNRFPELGIIQSHAQVKMNGGGDLENVVQIVEKHPQSTIVRTVSVRDLIAVFTTVESDPERIRREWLNAKNWTTGEQAILAIRSPLSGIAYVSESAPVVMTIEFAMPASDSAEYDAPTRYIPTARLQMCPCQCRDPEC